MQRAGAALIPRTARSSLNAPGSVLHLASLPRNVVPRDLRRMAEKVGVRGTYEIHLAYRNYRPDGRAYFVFPDREEAANAAMKLDGVLLSGNSAHAFAPYKSALLLASRGNGPSAGLKERGRTVHIEGLPDMRPDELANALARERFNIEDNADSPGVIKTVSEQEEKPAWLIRVNTVSEAHRLVRRYHMTLLDSDKALIQARIIY